MIQRGNPTMELTANIHRENGSYWAEVSDLPGCFAAGESLDELLASLQEGIELYLAENAEAALNGPLRVRSAVLSDDRAT